MIVCKTCRRGPPSLSQSQSMLPTLVLYIPSSSPPSSKLKLCIGHATKRVLPFLALLGSFVAPFRGFLESFS